METENVNIKNWKSLIKPSKIDVQMSDDLSKAKIVAEPLEKGYGLTLGNSLRRILLSSIRGAAVTSIQIDGVLHEFTSIKGVREDVTDIVLNVKSLALKSSSEGTKKLILDAKGPGEIKASDITPVADVEILNPELVICNLDENTSFHMEMNVNTGKGYVPAELNKPEEPPLGLIAIDSLYSPVKKVSYSVSTAREGKALDYDKLTMEVETDGSISAEQELSQIRSRTSEGRAVALSRGVKFGRKRGYDKFQVAEVMKKKSEGKGLGTIAKSLGMSRSMVQRIVKQEAVAVWNTKFNYS